MYVTNTNIKNVRLINDTKCIQNNSYRRYSESE